MKGTHIGRNVTVLRSDSTGDWFLTDSDTNFTFILTGEMAERFARLELETHGWPASETEADLEKINAGLHDQMRDRDIEIENLHRIVRETGERLQEANRRLMLGSSLARVLLNLQEGP